MTGIVGGLAETVVEAQPAMEISYEEVSDVDLINEFKAPLEVAKK